MKTNTFLALLIVLLSYSHSYGQSISESALKNGQKLSSLINILDLIYLEDIDIDDLTDKAMANILKELDPHSSYLTKEEMKESTEMFSGNFEGIGIEFNVLRDTIIVVNTIAGGPSEKVGLRSGDRIIMVDTTSVVGVSKSEVPGFLRGEKGTIVKLTIIRKGQTKPLEFTIVRDKIPLQSLDAAYLIDKGVAFIKLNRFMATTTEEFTTALDSLSRLEPINGVILDLRGNGGGQLDQAISLSSQFLPEGSLVVYTEGRTAGRYNMNSVRGGMYTQGALVVLIDESSASASEIVAGAIQDWDRGVVIGRSSFGKGLVQRLIPLQDTSAVQITMARYHTPSGRYIQRPYELGDNEGYYANYLKRFTKERLANPDSLFSDIPDSLKYKTLVKGRTVYGGGGINPDVFVAADTTRNSAFWSEAIAKGLFNDFVADYFDKNQKKLRRSYPTLSKYIQEFSTKDGAFEELYNHVVAQGIEDKDKEESSSVEPFMSLQLKALIAQKLWNTNAYFEVINSEDNQIIKTALEYINKNK